MLRRLKYLPHILVLGMAATMPKTAYGQEAPHVRLTYGSGKCDLDGFGEMSSLPSVRSAGILIGISSGHLVLETGVRYFNSKFSDSFIIGTQRYVGQIYSHQNFQFDHIGVPLSVAYRFRINKTISVAPGAHLTISYNNRMKSDVYYVGQSAIWPHGMVETNWSRGSLWAGAKIDLRIRLAKRLFMVVSPNAQLMLSQVHITSKSENNPYYSFSSPGYQPYIIGAEAGIMYKFRKRVQETSGNEDPTMREQQ